MKHACVAGLAITLLMCLGCGTQTPQKPLPSADTPEGAYRAFILAQLAGDEQAIRKLAVENENIDVLWKDGAYPKDVAALLEEQYRAMEISREVADGSSDLALNSSAFPKPPFHA